MEIAINKRKIGGENPVFIIAELSANHKQKFSIAAKTIEMMKESGADAVKLQTYLPHTITLNSDKKCFRLKRGNIWQEKTLYKLYQKAYTPWEWQPKLKKLAEKLGLIFFSTPFDEIAVDFLEKINVPAYKIASYEIVDIPLIERIALLDKPIIFSTGIAELEDVRLALKTCHRVGNRKTAILKCTSAYPTPFEEANLKTITDMQKKFRSIIGLSDHTLGISVPIAAVALGAKIIEKHFILNRKLKSVDAAFSLEPDEFKKMVISIRETEKALGKVSYKLTQKAKKSRLQAPSIFIIKDVKKGEEFCQNNIATIRPATGLHPCLWKKVLGRKARINIKKGTPLTWELIQ